MLDNDFLHSKIRRLRIAQRVTGWAAFAVGCVAFVALSLTALTGSFGSFCVLILAIAALALLGVIWAQSSARWEKLWAQTDEARAIARMSPAQQYFHEIHPNEPRGVAFPFGSVLAADNH